MPHDPPKHEIDLLVRGASAIMRASDGDRALARLAEALGSLGERVVRTTMDPGEPTGAHTMALVGRAGQVLGHVEFASPPRHRDVVEMLCALCARTIEAMRAREQAGGESLERMARAFVHDTNNILAVISGHAQLAGRSLGADHPAARPVRRVEQAVEHARDLVSSLLDLAHVPAPAHTTVDLSEFLTRDADLLEGLISSAHSLEIRVPDGESLLVRAVVARLRQMLVNLVLNACDAMPAGGVVRIDCERAGESAHPRARICVRDQGEGIDPQILGRVFDRGWTTRGSGRGLGLAIVREIVHEHAGSIEIQSAPGKGSCVRIELPLASSPCAPADSASSLRNASLR